MLFKRKRVTFVALNLKNINMSIKDSIDQYLVVVEKLNMHKTDYLKHITMLATSLLVIIVSLRTGDMCSLHSTISYCTTLASSLMCVLCGILGLIGVVNTQSRLEKAQRAEVHKLLNAADQIAQVIVVRPYRIFGIAEIICSVSFVLCVLSVCYYGFSMLYR